jgi:beta-lactam-binding protein with PASTA domain
VAFDRAPGSCCDNRVVTRLNGSVAVIVLGIVLAFAVGYVVGRGDRTTVPDLYGLGREGGGEHAAYVPLRKADLRLGQVRLHICGGNETNGMIVKQFPTSDANVPVGSAVDIWVAVPEGAVTLDITPGDQPCRHP